MPRPRLADKTGAIYRALKRGNARQPIFHKKGDFATFERVIGEGLENFAVKFFSYPWMNNYWHTVLGPQLDGEMSQFLYWTTMTHSTMTHTNQYHAHYHWAGEGHIDRDLTRVFQLKVTITV